MSGEDLGVDTEHAGWTRDVETRRDRRPQQVIEPDDWPEGKGGGFVLTPAWIYACVECGHQRRIASESPRGFDRCPDCGETRRYEPLGELQYPDREGSEEQRLELSEKQRERFESIKEQCTNGGSLPKPSDEMMLKSLMDTWDAVSEGYYSDGQQFDHPAPHPDGCGCSWCDTAQEDSA